RVPADGRVPRTLRRRGSARPVGAHRGQPRRETGEGTARRTATTRTSNVGKRCLVATSLVQLSVGAPRGGIGYRRSRAARRRAVGGEERATGRSHQRTLAPSQSRERAHSGGGGVARPKRDKGAIVHARRSLGRPRGVPAGWRSLPGPERPAPAVD